MLRCMHNLWRHISLRIGGSNPCSAQGGQETFSRSALHNLDRNFCVLHHLHRPESEGAMFLARQKLHNAQ